MKKFFTLIALLVVTFSMSAGIINEKEAMEIALKYVGKTMKPTSTQSETRTPRLTLAHRQMSTSLDATAEAQPLFYVFNNEKSGFVIVSGDDAMKPVIGYSDNGEFDVQNMPDGLKWWFEAMSVTMANVDKDVVTTSETSNIVPFSTSVKPLIKTKWDQGTPFNNLCPIDNYHGDSYNSVTGCVATAMAQILYYHRYPEKPMGTYSFTTVTHKFNLQGSFDEFTFDYDKMLEVYGYGEGAYTDEQANAVAQLCYACGLAVNMDYCYNGSGSALSSATMINVFGVDPSCASAYRNGYTSTEWEQLLKSELMANRPVYYSGRTSSDMGHAFICDGFNSDGLFHINWGWGGYGDGYFELTALNGSDAPGENAGYNFGQGIVYNIKPFEGGKPVHCSELYSFDGYTSSSTTTIRYIDGKNVSCLKISANTTNFINSGGKETDLSSVGLVDKNGKTILVSESPSAIGLPSNYYFPSCNHADIYLPKTNCKLADGEYEVRVVVGETIEDMRPVRGLKGQPGLKEYTVTVTNGVPTFGESATSELQLTVDDEYVLMDSEYGYNGYENPFSFNVTNSGEYVTGELKLLSKQNNTTLSTGIALALEKGETMQVHSIYDLVLANDGEDEIEVYFNGGNITDKLIGTVKIKLVTPVAGTPDIKLVDVSVPAEVGKDEDVTCVFTIKNEGGFMDALACFYGGYLQASYAMYLDQIPSFSIDKGETKQIAVTFNASTLLSEYNVSSGDFMVLLQFVEKETYNEIALIYPNKAFVITDKSGVEDVLVDKKEIEADIYNLHGVNVGRDFEKLPKGIYIVNGKKVIK